VAGRRRTTLSLSLPNRRRVSAFAATFGDRRFINDRVHLTIQSEDRLHQDMVTSLGRALPSITTLCFVGDSVSCCKVDLLYQLFALWCSQLVTIRVLICFR